MADENPNWPIEKLAWAAGFFDGEGSVGIYARKNVRHSHLTMDVSQRDPRPLLILKEMFGGYIRKWDDKRGNNAVTWHWSLTSKKVAVALTQLLPYLILKRERAELAIAYQATMKYSRRSSCLTEKELETRKIIREEMRLLNRKGREVSVIDLPVGGYKD